MSGPFLATPYLRILFRHLRLDSDGESRFFAGTTWNTARLTALDSQVPFEEQVRLYRNALTMYPSGGLGLSVGPQLHLAAHGPLGTALYTASDLQTALQTLRRYSEIRAALFRMLIERREDRCSIRIKLADVPIDLMVFFSESIVCTLCACIEFFAGRRPAAHSLSFAYEAPSHAAEYEAVYEIPVAFAEPATAVTFDAGLLALSSPEADAAAHSAALARCTQSLRERRSGDGLAATVRQLMQENPGQIWTVVQVAEHLHLSSRTLIRRLGAENQRFQEIRDEVLKRQARRYLEDERMTVEAVAAGLGFADASSFRRSFKRWFGQPPAAYVQMRRRRKS